jgi:hypothetical protein
MTYSAGNGRLVPFEHDQGRHRRNGPNDMLKQLEEENRRLKRMVADLSLDKQMLQDVLSKKL